MAHKYSAIDLFSGCGGLTQGLKSSGFNVLCAAEIRSEARETYELNHPETKVYGDICELTGAKILKELNINRGQLDLLAACPPCQGFSSIRIRNGEVATDDERNELIFEVLRLCLEIQPKCILIENVPKLLTDRRLQEFKERLEEEYSFTADIVNAKDCGVPQRRKRMILMASRLGEIKFKQKPMKIRTVADAIKGLPSPDGEHNRPLHRIKQRLSAKVLERISSIKVSRSELPEELQLDCHKRYPQGFRDIYGRMAWDDVAPTITRSSHNPSKGRYVHPEENRGLTLYEAMLLQAFPRSYKFPIKYGIGKISSMIGEAIPPPFAKVHGDAIIKHLDQVSLRAKNHGLEPIHADAKALLCPK